jgi:peptidoglycan/LPS O-acetylase OafA/YrhL
MVLLFHLRKLNLGPARVLRLIPDHGHDFVILFFVLSGYVIAATVERKRSRGLRDYVLDRMARVYSVAVPVLLLCTALSLFAHDWLDPQKDWPDGIGPAFTALGLNLLFLGQSWWAQVTPFLDDPYWSLCYEVVYYAAFGLFVFRSGWTRALGLLAVALIAGPKILLLMPCWLLGAFLYHARDRWQPGPLTAVVAAFLLPPLILVLLYKSGLGPAAQGLLQRRFPEAYAQLDFSKSFLVDHANACVVALHIHAVRYVRIPWPSWLGRVIVEAAAMSFTLYLLHTPLVFVAFHAAGEARTSLGAFAVTAAGIPLLAYTLSRLTEARRGALRARLDRLLPGAPAA